MARFADLTHQTLLHVEASADNSEVRFVLSDGRAFRMHHHQDCCESVELVDVCGELDDLCGAWVLDAREETSQDETGQHESATWTFYVLQTDKGAATLRWLGMSNGYYSETVSFEACALTERERARIEAHHLDRRTAVAGGQRAPVRL